MARPESGFRCGASSALGRIDGLEVARNRGHADALLIGRTGVALDGPFVKGGAGFTTTVSFCP